jgi:hypothetical protein
MSSALTIELRHFRVIMQAEAFAKFKRTQNSSLAVSYEVVPSLEFCNSPLADSSDIPSPAKAQPADKPQIRRHLPGFPLVDAGIGASGNRVILRSRHASSLGHKLPSDTCEFSARERRQLSRPRVQERRWRTSGYRARGGSQAGGR